jgi:hypothetical protein
VNLGTAELEHGGVKVALIRMEIFWSSQATIVFHESIRVNSYGIMENGSLPHIYNSLVLMIAPLQRVQEKEHHMVR